MTRPILALTNNDELANQLARVLPDGSLRVAASIGAGKKCLTRREQLLILDTELPHALGFISGIRMSTSFEHLPVLGFAPVENVDRMVETLEAGATDCLTLPVHDGLLRAKANHLIRSFRAQVGWRFGPYRVLEPLGKGSFGTVWRATHEDHEEPVALKLLSEAYRSDVEVEGRFVREVALLSKLRLPFLVRFFEAGAINDRGYVAMELVPGRTAAEILDRDGPLSLETGLLVARNVSCALAGMQAHGLLHRDVKPGNVMIGQDGDSTLIDLGLAKGNSAADKLTASSAVVGTPLFLAPEVVRGKPETFSSDVYSLGATLWTLLSGRLPHEAPTQYALLLAIATSKGIPKLSSLRSDLPVEFTRLVDAMVQPDPKKRPSSANDVSADFSALFHQHVDESLKR